MAEGDVIRNERVRAMSKGYEFVWFLLFLNIIRVFDAIVDESVSLNIFI